MAGDAQPISDSQPGRSPLLWLAFALAAWIAFSFSFTPLRVSHDEWWHLKTGQYVWEQGLPKNDIFTYTAERIPWHNHEWLTQVGMWLAWRAGEASGFGGVRMVIVIKSLFIILAFAGFGWLVGRRMREPAWAALGAAMMAALARRTFYPRPPFVTYLLLGLVIWTLMEWRAGRWRDRHLTWLVPLFALWANLHGGWQAGLLVIAAFWADAAWGWVRTRQRRPLFVLTALGLGCAAGALVNPYGYHLYELYGRVMGERYLMATIGELQPPDWRWVWVLEAVILTLAGAAIRPVRARGFVGTFCLLLLLHFLLRAPADPQFLGWLIRRVPGARGWVEALGLPARGAPVWQCALALPIFVIAIYRSRIEGWFAHALLVAYFGMQAILHVRHLSLLGVILLPAWSRAMESWWIALESHWAARPESAARMAHMERMKASPATVLIIILLVLLTGFWSFGLGVSVKEPSMWRIPVEGYSYFDRNLMLARGTETQPGAYPEKAVNFLLQARLPERLWNGGNYAGYLIWRLAPERMKLFTDNRYDIFGGQFIRQEHSVLEGETTATLRGAPVKIRVGLEPWDTVLDRWNAQTLFLPASAPVNARLLESRRWRRVWQDHQFTIWVRDTPTNAEAIERALTMPRPTPWFRDNRSPHPNE